MYVFSRRIGLYTLRETRERSLRSWYKDKKVNFVLNIYMVKRQSVIRTSSFTFLSLKFDGIRSLSYMTGDLTFFRYWPKSVLFQVPKFYTVDPNIEKERVGGTNQERFKDEEEDVCQSEVHNSFDRKRSGIDPSPQGFYYSNNL